MRQFSNVSRCCRLLALLALACCIIAGAASCKKEPVEEKDGDWRITTGPAESIPGRAVQKSMGVECQNNLQQIRSALMTSQQENDGEYPASLSEIGYPNKVLRCPINKQAYQYDAATGEVHCDFPGHEKF